MVCAVVQAQTYTQSQPFGCDMASAHPITAFSQFACRGINYGSGVELFFWGGTPARIELFTLDYTVVSSSVTLTAFSVPTSTDPGTFAFEWAGADSSGNQYSGTVYGTWTNHQVCGGRGCYWWRPVIGSSVLTINQTSSPADTGGASVLDDPALQKALSSPQPLTDLAGNSVPNVANPFCGVAYPIGSCIIFFGPAIRWLANCYNFNGHHLVSWCGAASMCPCEFYSGSDPATALAPASAPAPAQ